MASLLLCFLLLATASLYSAGETKKYIVYLGDQPHPSFDAVGHHHRLLSEILEGCYTLSMNAFAARLTDEEAGRVAQLDGVVSVFPSRPRRLHTTRAWDFVGFPVSAPRNLTESNVIVAILDSGELHQYQLCFADLQLICVSYEFDGYGIRRIDPTSESFDDKGYGPPPAKWRGRCAFSGKLRCNNKVIGARWFRLDRKVPANDVLGPEDHKGHGTHVASTAAGIAVPGAGVFGMAVGTARGGVPSARIASYKICYADDICNDEDILAAFDAAIADGVDVINLSWERIPEIVHRYTRRGAYHAMRRRVLTVSSAGNQGPMHRTVVNYSPWMLTVGASSIDRQFGTDLVLGNGKRVTGVSVNTFESSGKFRPLVLGFEAANTGMSFLGQMCGPGSLNPEMVKGAIVLCKITGGAGVADSVVKEAGGEGLVVQMTMPVDRAEAFKIPSTTISKDDGVIVDDYIKNSGGKPVARIEKSLTFTPNGTFVASFSSRGPNPLYSEILKPDLVAPGMNILAAYPTYLPFTNDPTDPRRSRFQLMSGTSMATPHVTAAAAYVKSFHPKWSPATIRSALMTTAGAIVSPNSTRNKDLEYAYGAGLINPSRAVDPGLVYDADEGSYLRFLCTKHPNTTAVSILTGTRSFDCRPFARAEGYDGLNYPSFHYVVPESTRPSKAFFRRIVKNVGDGPAVYKASVESPKGVDIVVKPERLQFAQPGQKMVFVLEVSVAPVLGRPPYILSGSLTWNDGVHSVRSPVAIHYT
ncbi:hypothetical protein HPP92_003574 [Vanilla planifolia]|uniref:Uncharacterized protein n=1 Tax=Vanilla planifolia TaxID=51239 RepID=A0A835RXV5_VANPL|nr:hypothetical protein HPP92_003574 [Vanilla planifolia]